MSSPRPPTSGGTPNSGNVSSGIMRCSSNPDDFTSVQIHTAKCAICDQRNMATMRRCPGCTYQVCQPCFTARNGAPLIHGNLASGGLSGLPAAPVRRRVFNRADSAPPVPPGGPSASKVAVTATQAAAPTAVMAKPTSTRATAAAPAKRVRGKRKGKGKAPAQSESEPESEGDDYAPGRDSPTPSTKRRKTSTETKVANEGVEQKKTHVTRSAARILPDNDSGLQSLAGDGQKEKGDIDTSILGREKPENDSLQQLLEKAGVDTPENRYELHLLQRVMPVILPAPANCGRPTIRLPADQRRTSTVLDPGNGSTVRDYVKDQGAARAHARGFLLDEDRKLALHGALIAATLLLLRQLNVLFDTGPGSLATLTPDTKIGELSAAQKGDLDRMVDDTSLRMLNELFPPDTGTPTRKEHESAVALANMARRSPSVGLFQASPSRRGSAHIMGPPSLLPVSGQFQASFPPDRRGSGHIQPANSPPTDANDPSSVVSPEPPAERTTSATGHVRQRVEPGDEGDVGYPTTE